MSEENVEVVRRLHGAINADDVEAALALLDPEIVWVQNPNAPDPRTYYGHDGIRELREVFADAFEDVRLEAERFIDVSDGVVSLGYMRARGVGSGVEVRSPRGWVWTVRDGKVVRHQSFDNHEAALEAAGLSE
jgi:ketosteroid isomerase-like protein